MFQDLINALEESLFMIFTTSLTTLLLGFPLSILQAISIQRSNKNHLIAYKILNTSIHLVSAIPYIIILIAIIPFTHWLMGVNARYGSFFAVIPLTLAAFPLFTKLCTEALNKIPKSMIETALSLGASPKQVVFKVIIPEALPNIIHGFSQLLIQIIGLTVVVGVLGGGGIGRLLVEKGYRNYEASYVIAILGLLILLVVIVQSLGHFLAYGSFKAKH